MFAQERPWSVSPCELLKSPGMYNETMVSVPGLVLYSLQEFSTLGYDCIDDFGVLRLEFGGNRPIRQIVSDCRRPVPRRA